MQKDPAPKWASYESRPSEFRQFLQDELVRRCKKNSKYSLRAFAKSLGIGPAFLSMMMASKRAVTAKTIKELGLKLGLGPDEIDRYLRQNEGTPTTDAIGVNYRQIALDHFQAIADWYHFAILELVSVDSFESSPRWIAKTLGISVGEVNAAVERLIRLEMLEVAKNGRWKNISGSNTNVDNELVAAARRKLQKQILEKALEALEEIPVQRRDQSSMTMAVDASLLPEAKKKLTRFRRELTDFLQNGKKKDEVYNLSLSLYPLTSLSPNKNKGASK